MHPPSALIQACSTPRAAGRNGDVDTGPHCLAPSIRPVGRGREVRSTITPSLPQIQSGGSKVHTAFGADTDHDSYDPEAMNLTWRVLSQTNLTLETFAAEWSGKMSPAHGLWNSFELSLTRLSVRFATQTTSPDAVTRG